LQIGLPTSLAGKSVLDIGAWDGFFSFEAERRGAERVVAVDSHSWGGGGWGSKEGFRCAREILGSRVEDVDLDVMDISAERLGTFDVVLFLGVLYHLRHPLLALERVLSVTKDLLILETHVDLLSTRRPAMAFYPGRELDGDMSNWWGPNPPALVKMLESAGFKRVQAIATPPSALVRFMKSVAKTPFRRTNPFVEMLNGRMVVHAHR
jgi:tRNA (mo5U34)-methyltransferase